MKRFMQWPWVLLLFFFLLFLPACFPSKKVTVASTATLLEEIAKASNKQSDLRLIREGTPAYLMLMDGMVEAYPGSDQLLLATAKAYASYASIFDEDEDKEYAKSLLGRGKEYALRSLEVRGLKDPLRTPFEEFKASLQGFGKEDVPYLFWGASCWADWIAHHLDSMEALADLPRVESMMNRVLEIDEGYFYGGPHLFMGIWFSSRPPLAGGDLKRAQRHFLKALELGQGKFLMVYVYYANYYARQAMDRDLFLSTLQNVLETPARVSPDLTLVNTIAKKKAQALLGRVEDYFD